MAETWDDKAGYLAESRRMLHNADYWRFLVREVWRLTEAPVRIADFGCGFGWGAMWLLPMLPAGSSYIGFDISDRDGARAALEAAISQEAYWGGVSSAGIEQQLYR